MAIGILRGTLDWFAKLGLSVRDDPPKTIDLTNREWGTPAGGLAVSIREIPKEDPDQLPSVSAVLRNVSDARQRFSIPAWLIFYSIGVTRPDGSPAALTPFGRELLKPERHPRGVTLDLAPGQPVETEIPVGSIFDMRAKGEYRIRLTAARPDAPVLESNQIAVRV